MSHGLISYTVKSGPKGIAQLRRGIRRFAILVDMMKLMLLGLAVGAMAFAASSVYDFTLNSIDGAATPLSSFKGKVVLLVNVASKCGYTPQYAGPGEALRDLQGARVW